MSSSQPSTPPFLRLPPEIRLQIFSLILLPQSAPDLLPSFVKVTNSAQDSFDYDKRQHGTDRPATTDLSRPTLLFRTIDATRFEKHAKSLAYSGDPLKRTVITVHADRFRARAMPTTYHAVNAASLATRGAPALLRTCRLIHAEAAAVLYGGYTFDFDTHVEALSPFLSDLTPQARSCVRSLRVVKRALSSDGEYDKAEWSTMWDVVTDPTAGLDLKRLFLGVVAGRPIRDALEEIVPYEARDFELLRELEGMEWLRPLLEVKGLKELDVEAIVQHCPPAANSIGMARYIRFSASIEGGLAEFLRSQLLCA